MRYGKCVVACRRRGAAWYLQFPGQGKKIAARARAHGERYNAFLIQATLRSGFRN